MAKTRVALIYGGVSGERGVSRLTAASVMRAMDAEKYEAVPVAIAPDGTWVPGETTPEALEAGGVEREIEPSATTVRVGFGRDRGLFLISDDEVTNLNVDVAFPLVHGPFGEDGTMQGLLEMAGIPYVGDGVFASAAGMDKAYMKVVLEGVGIPVAPYVVAEPHRWNRNSEGVLQEATKLHLPLYVKPARAGSSIGISRVADFADLRRAVEEARKVDPKVLIEEGIKGREIECAVLQGRGDASARASVLGEIVLDVQWYDFSTKYLATEGFHMAVPADVPAEKAADMRDMAVAVFEAFGCEGMTRVDFFLADDGRIFVNEHNTVPGFTAVSMYPVLWEHTGLPYSALIDELIELALAKPAGVH